jgi:hypothetical protein
LFGGSGESGESFIISASTKSSFPRSKMPFNLLEGQMKYKVKFLEIYKLNYLCLPVFI